MHETAGSFMLGLGTEEASPLIHLCTARLAPVRFHSFKSIVEINIEPGLVQKC